MTTKGRNRNQEVEVTQDEIAEACETRYPYGHPSFVNKTLGELQLHNDKNHDYASGGDPLGNFKRVANIVAQYPGLSMRDPAVVPLIFSLKQLDAVLWGLSQGIEHKVEGPVERLRDISVYAKLTQIILEEQVADSLAEEI